MGLDSLVRGKIDENSVFISFASDGMDNNNSSAAGAIVDIQTKNKIEKMNISPSLYLKRIDSYSIFELTKDLIKTGPTGANVSDLMVLVNQKAS